MGDTVATTENGYERINKTIEQSQLVAGQIDDLSDMFVSHAPGKELMDICDDAYSVMLQLESFARRYQEQLECISIDQ